jgi:SAM-dependent methyltransferase
MSGAADEGGAERAHGVTPGLSRDYATRTADRQAAFALAHLRPDMQLLDLGAGPGTITIGLARVVAPGLVIGVDLDAAHVETAAALAVTEGVPNATFQQGDATDLPFEDASFDAAFENDVLLHLGSNAIRAVREVRRVLKPGGLFAARDATAAVWGGQTDEMRQFDSLFEAWHRGRGSDIGLGSRLPAILGAAGFTGLVVSVSADVKQAGDEVREHARIMTFLLDGPMGAASQGAGLIDESGLGRIAASIAAWADRPDAFFANVHVEVVGRRPA